ncbi:MAG: MATE family efflux transporter, partial [Thermoguttaceae bacterium]|nr:MATE family efflux transporter [Thermoguttaceae bacterium]
MIISSGSIALMQFADRVFLTWFDANAMGAAFSSSHILWLFAAFPFSIAGYANAFVSQYNGAGQYRQAGKIIWQGVFLGLGLMPVFLLLSPFNIHLFRLFRHTPEMTLLENSYLYYSLWGIGALIANEALASFFVGQKKVNIVMAINIIGVILNIILDYIMIFGIHGFCRWGINGAAIATTISQWIRFLIFVTLMFLDDARQKRFGIWEGCRLDWKCMKRLVKFGGMGGINSTVEMLGFSFFIMIIAMIGEQENAATAIAFNLNALTFMPVLGTGVAVITLVGNQIGAGHPQLARRATFSALLLGIIITGLFVFLFFFFPDICLFPYLKNDIAGFASLRRMTTVILRFVALYLFFDSITIIFASAIKGAGDIKFIMLTTIIMYSILILLLWIDMNYYAIGIYGYWGILTVFTLCLSIIFSFRFFQGKWMRMKLTEPDLSGPDSMRE